MEIFNLEIRTRQILNLCKSIHFLIRNRIKPVENIMSRNYNEMKCPFCGRIVRDSDKFCIFCGSRLGQQQPPRRSRAGPSISVQEKKELEDEVNKDLGFMQGRVEDDEDDEAPFVMSETSQDDLEDRVLETSEKKKKRRKNKDKDDEKNDTGSVDLPDDIREQLEVKMELAVVEHKKKMLKDKLKDFQSDLDENRYNFDMEYAEKINLTLNAYKELKNELNEQEDSLREKISGTFRIDELEEELEVKREQLIELKRSFKMHTTKKDVYEQLKTEYVEQYEGYQKELDDLRSNIVRWMSKEKSEQNRLKTRTRLLDARYKSREITKDIYEEEKKKLQKETELTIQKVAILENYARKKKKKLFNN
jgi:chromosome segregation ATPase